MKLINIKDSMMAKQIREVVEPTLRIILEENTLCIIQKEKAIREFLTSIMAMSFISDFRIYAITDSIITVHIQPFFSYTPIVKVKVWK